MSLDDKFEPNDGGIIDTIDTKFLSCFKKIGKFWQDKTYKSTTVLVRYLYGSSAGAFFASGSMYAQDGYLTTAIALGVCGFVNCHAALTSRLRPRSGLSLEMACEASGLPKKTYKVAALVSAGIGTGFLIEGGIQIAQGLIYSDYERLVFGSRSALIGLGSLFGCASMYLNRVNLGEPPKKPKKKSLKDRLKEKVRQWLPHPVPQPIKETYNAH